MVTATDESGQEKRGGGMILRTDLRRLAAVAAMLGVAGGFFGGAAFAAGQPAGDGVHTARQAENGRAVYVRSCAICHRTDLRGNFEAPPLAGASFLSFWGDRTPQALVERIRTTMPPDRPGRLREQDYLDIVAYLLQANGAPAGDRALTAATVATIGAVASGETAPAPAITAAAQGRARRPDTRTAVAAVPGGVTVAGEVQDYTPVTDELLREPDPDDWLMVRRNYEAWSYSPLDAITRDNVGELELQWMWAMNEGGRNAPSPIAHDGVLYFAGFGPVVQALDARTGDLIWEHEVGVEAGQLASSSRNLAIYEDKLYLATADARLIALDARTGAEVWTTRIADDAQGFRNTSGPVVAGGKVVQGLGGCGQFTREGCFISAYDATTGARLWRFNTVARADEPGGNTWADLPDYLRGGGETWITGSYDPVLDLVYFGVAQAKPWVAVSRGMTVHDPALYTSSTVALRPGDGDLAWHFQHVPGESLDLDEVFERVLVDLEDRRVVFSAGKHGILWKLDRETGEFLGHKETVFQNVFDRIDPETGAVTYRQDIVDAAVRATGPGVPQHRRRQELAPDELPPRVGAAHPPALPDLHGAVGPRGRPGAGLGRRGDERAPVLRDARHRGPARQARGVRRRDSRGGVERRAAGALPDRRPVDGRGSRLCR